MALDGEEFLRSARTVQASGFAQITVSWFRLYKLKNVESEAGK